MRSARCLLSPLAVAVYDARARRWPTCSHEKNGGDAVTIRVPPLHFIYSKNLNP
jgi:hypothetical protein